SDNDLVQNTRGFLRDIAFWSILRCCAQRCDQENAGRNPCKAKLQTSDKRHLTPPFCYDTATASDAMYRPLHRLLRAMSLSARAKLFRSLMFDVNTISSLT